MSYFDSLIKAYEKWEKTPEGKKRSKEVKKRKLEPINDLPEGWELQDYETGSYYVYWNGGNEEVMVTFNMTAPIHFGGKQEVQVLLKDLDYDTDEGKIKFKESVEGDDWKKVIKEANKVAIDLMRTYKRRRAYSW